MIKTIKSNFYNQNIYILTNDNQNTLIIDPGNSGPQILAYLKEQNLNPQAVLITHGHFDHFSGLNEVLAVYPNLDIYIGKKDVHNLFDHDLNLSYLNRNQLVFIDKDKYFNQVIGVEQKTYNIHNFKVEIIDIPGHTPGSVCFLFPDLNYIFTGDTLLRESIGRVDLKHSVPQYYRESLLKFSHLDSTMIIYPGHGIKTKIGYELEHNEALKQIIQN